MKVAIIGIGWVGKSMQKLFPDAYIYSHGKTTKLGTKEGVNACDVAFICVPTPNINNDIHAGDGPLDITAIEDAVSWIDCPLIVIRSTVNPGTCDYLMNKYNKYLVMQPEYLGETPAHPMYDPKTRQFIVIGGAPAARKMLIDLYMTVYNANTIIRQVTNLEAEIIKLTENRAIAFKVAQCQELYDVCKMANVDYYTIQQAVYSDDPRFNLWWTAIFPNARGFNSKCIPKDIYAWCAWAESLGYTPELTRAMLKVNKAYITPHT